MNKGLRKCPGGRTPGVRIRDEYTVACPICERKFYYGTRVNRANNDIGEEHQQRYWAALDTERALAHLPLHYVRKEKIK